MITPLRPGMSSNQIRSALGLRRKRRTKRRENSGFVYVIAIKGSWGLYKVGKSDNPTKRLAQLQVGHPSELIVLRSYRTANMHRDERRVHRILSDFRVRGEWFNCPVGAIDLAWRQTERVKGRGLTKEENDGSLLPELARDFR